MKKNPPPHRRSLENEVILAVILLYLLIAVVMIGVHYMQAFRQKTASSSSSISHTSFRNPELLTDVHRVLTDAGDQKISGLRLNGNLQIPSRKERYHDPQHHQES
jgi:hypothetical protein